MKERPILFSSEMVRAILEGRKTQTRRVVKINGEPPKTITERNIEPYNGTAEQLMRAMKASGHKCKFGEVGDRLWVKETHSFPIKEPCNRANAQCPQVAYRADGESAFVNKWKPSIFMPRWASRITLEIVSVRVERLQDITEEDAKAEGVTGALVSEEGVHCAYKTAYAVLWDEINGKGAWESNPWVWVIDFKKVGEK